MSDLALFKVQTDPNKKLYDMDVYQAADFLGYHVQTTRDLARLGKIPALKRRRAWLFSSKELSEFLEKETQKHRKLMDESARLKHDLDEQE